MIAGPARLRHGTVASFDEAAGLGTLIEDPTTPTHPEGTDRTQSALISPALDSSNVPIRSDALVVGFHCAAIADGSRTICVGERVVFRLRAGNHGSWEAIDIVSVQR